MTNISREEFIMAQFNEVTDRLERVMDDSKFFQNAYLDLSNIHKAEVKAHLETRMLLANERDQQYVEQIEKIKSESIPGRRINKQMVLVNTEEGVEEPYICLDAVLKTIDDVIKERGTDCALTTAVKIKGAVCRFLMK